MVILEDVKTALGILPDNLGFNYELLICINAAKTTLVHLGLTEFDIDIDESTQWPTFPNYSVTSLARHFIILKTKQLFDPSASETISRSMDKFVMELEGRVSHEVDEVLNAG